MWLFRYVSERGCRKEEGVGKAILPSSEESIAYKNWWNAKNLPVNNTIPHKKVLLAQQNRRLRYHFREFNKSMKYR
jgi:hypothetical protein